MSASEFFRNNVLTSDGWEVWEDIDGQEPKDCAVCKDETCDGCELIKELDDESKTINKLNKIKRK
jgi:hypothetical protein